ncbi:Rne/Rng family ribonuclease [Cellulomonas sp. URHE0023]|uniref:Rne/Rng family ribonuclease n=1 Tax=Cellulomonas sp. URHE0023 TaxID=1380354 RepID=UPI00068A5C49|nr:Rne/Rng family ribonuclease [Cellulomonas sp. URHE0023]
MTDEATPTTATTSVEGEATKAPPRRRRATRVTAAPSNDVATEAITTLPTPEPAPAVAVAQPVEAPVAPATPVKKSRRVTRTVVPVSADGPPAAAEPAAVSAEPVVADAPAAPAAAPVPDASSEDAPPAKAPRRRRASTRPVTTPEPVVEAEPEAEAEVDDETAAPAPTFDVLAQFASSAPVQVPLEPAEPAAATTTSTTTTGPRFATTALLFQAPDPTATRPRRRRAQASTGSPEEISEAAHRIEADEPTAAAVAESEQADAHGAEASSTTTSSSARGSRRRGRRGRSGGGAGTGAGTDEPQDDSAEDDLEAAFARDLAQDLAQSQDRADEDEPDTVAADEADDSDEDEDGPDDIGGGAGAARRRRRRGGRGRRSRPDSPAGASEDEATDDESAPSEDADDTDSDESGSDDGGSSRRRRRRRRGSSGGSADAAEPRATRTRAPSDEVTALRGSTRLEAKRQRRRDGRDAGRRRQIITESEFLARRESVERTMIVREKNARTQIAVLEDGVLVEHYVSNQAQTSMVGNVYLGRVQNVLPSMEAAFVDVGKGRNAVLYAGEVNWDATGLEGGSARRIEQALKSGDPVLVQVTKDPIGHKGARLTSQVTLAGRYLVYVPGGGMTGISRKLPDTERNRLKRILREIVPESAGVIVRTAAEGASEDELRADIARLQGQWEAIEKKSKTASAPALLQGEPDMAIRVVRDIFNDDFSKLVVEGAEAWTTISSYIDELAPDLAQKVERWTSQTDVFSVHRIDEQLAKGMDRKVWLPSGGSLVIDRTEAMTVVDVNTGKFTGSGGTLEETVTRNNLEAAEEIVRQLRLRDIGGIIVIDFIDMVLESNRDLVLRRLVECLGRDRTKHQVAEVTSLGLVQMTRKRVGQGLVEAFSENCEHCHGRGFIVHEEPIEKSNQRPDAGEQQAPSNGDAANARSRRKRGGAAKEPVSHAPHAGVPVLPEAREAVKATLATIAAAAAHAHEHEHEHAAVVGAPDQEAPVDEVAELETEQVAPAQPALDVFAALAASHPGATAAEHREDGEGAQLELTPVPADVFEAGDDTELEAGDETELEAADETELEPASETELEPASEIEHELERDGVSQVDPEGESSEPVREPEQV